MREALLLLPYPPPSPSSSQGGFAPPSPHSTHNHHQQQQKHTASPPPTVNLGCATTANFGSTVNLGTSTTHFGAFSTVHPTVNSTVYLSSKANLIAPTVHCAVVDSAVANLAGNRQEAFGQPLAVANSGGGSSNHIQLMSQMVHGLTPEGVKLEPSSSSSTSDGKPFGQDTNFLDSQSAAAAAVFQQHNFVCYNNPFYATTTPGWPYNVAGTPHWSNFNANNKKGRQTYQREQTLVLERKFQECSYVSKKQRDELRSMTRLSDRQIKIWFQNRRMKAKKEKIRCSDEGDNQATLIPANPPNKSSLHTNPSASPTNNLGPLSLNNNCSGSSAGVMDDHLHNSSTQLGEFIGAMENHQMNHMMGAATSSSMIDPLTAAAWSHTQHTHQLFGQHFPNPYSYYYSPTNGGLN